MQNYNRPDGQVLLGRPSLKRVSGCGARMDFTFSGTALSLSVVLKFWGGLTAPPSPHFFSPYRTIMASYKGPLPKGTSAFGGRFLGKFGSIGTGSPGNPSGD